MKKSILNWNLMAYLVAIILFAASCNNATHDHQHEGQQTEHHQHQHQQQQSSTIEMETDTTAYAYTAPYICPMYCKGSGSDKAGSCPACGMDYIKNEK